MSRPILSTSLIIIAVIAFFSFIDPTYKEIKVLNAESAQFNEALVRSKELQAVRDKLLSRYNTFSTEDLDRIEKLLPDNVDNVRLILDLDGIASKYGLLVRDVSISKDEESEEIVKTGELFGGIQLSFKVTGPYEEFKDFSKDLEKSLRIVDVERLNLSPTSADKNLLNFEVTIKTYWLK